MTVTAAINGVAGSAAWAEALLLSRLGDVTLAMLSADFQKRLGDRRNRHRLETAHAS